MRLRSVLLAAAVGTLVATSGTSNALVAPRGEDRVVAKTERETPRAHRSVTWGRQNQLDAHGLAGWTAMFDRDTGVPVRLWGAGAVVPGAMTDGAIAETAARAFLAQHIRLLAPGATAADFVVVANQLSGAGDVRSIGFQQHANGVRVVGGSISVSFKADRMVMVGSTALPGVAASMTTSPQLIDLPRLEAAAVAFVGAAPGRVTVSSHAVERVVLPIVRPHAAGGISYRLVDQLVVTASPVRAGKWMVWIDALTAEPVARQSMLNYASGRVLFDAPDRSPSFGTRGGKAVPFVSHSVNNASTMADSQGRVSWASGSAQINPGLEGPQVNVITLLGNALADTLTLADGGDVVWGHPTEEFADAQISAYVFATQAKTFARAHLDPSLEWLDAQLEVYVNEDDVCNAVSTGDEIYFYKAQYSATPLGTNPNCQNTARIADVVYHEFGHSLHHQAIIPGVGNYEHALGEGMADMFAALITKDSGMGRGFFYTQAPLRELAPTTPKHWPEDLNGEEHNDGEIIGQTFWDLRVALVAKLGEEAGDAQTRKIFYGALQRSVDIPSTYAEALVSDDDDGDLTNGTPNQCAIQTAWARHGIADLRTTIGITDPVREGYAISMNATGSTNTECPPPGIESAVVSYKVRGGARAEESSGSIDLTLDGTTYSGQLPQQMAGSVVEYKVTISLTDGSKILYPSNEAIPFYEMYVGEVEPLWCASFEDADRGADAWTHGSNRTDEWEVGAPMGLGTDPAVAHGGTNVFGIDLTNDGSYRRNSQTWAETPEIALNGHRNVRLQYYRWLGVEDATYDFASIIANDVPLWTNPTSGIPENGVNSVDKEWQFHDVDLSEAVTGDTMRIRFELESDQGLAFGGWTLDDVCVVAMKDVDCEIGDDGTCVPEVFDNGCCSVGAKPTSGIMLSLGVLGLVLRRRRKPLE